MGETNSNSNSSSKVPPFVIKATMAASLGGILFGYDLGIISAALPELTHTFNLSPEEEEMIVSFLYIGCCIGAIFGGMFCDKYGRKITIIFTDVLFISGAMVLYTAKHINVILLGRIIVGCAVAVSAIADVAYLHEISPAKYRGTIVSCNEACISLGFLMSYIVGYIMSIHILNDSWRYMFLMGCAIAAIQCLAMSFMPESPVWLKYKGRSQDAEYALMQIYGEDYVDDSSNPVRVLQVCHDEGDKNNEGEGELDHHEEEDATNTATSASSSMQDSDQTHPLPPSTPPSSSTHRHLPSKKSKSSRYSSLQIEESCTPPSSPDITTKNHHDEHEISPSPSQQLQQSEPQSFIQYITYYHRQVIIAAFLAIMQQFCGHTNVLNFAPSIFRQVGFYSERTELISTVMVGTVKFLTTCVVIYKIEYVAGGRRNFLLCGLTMIAFSLVLLTVAYLGEGAFVHVIAMDGADNYTDMDADADVDANHDDNEDGSNEKLLIEKIAAMMGVFGVAIGYAISLGPLTWLLVSEIFPSSIRGRALGGTTILTNLSAILVSYTFLTGQEIFGPSIPFAIYCLLTILSVVFAVAFIPDTAGKTPCMIHMELERMWPGSGEAGSVSMQRPRNDVELS